MAPDIAKIDTNRQLGPGLPAGNFSDEVLRWILHGKQSLRSDSEGPAHPIYRPSDEKRVVRTKPESVYFYITDEWPTIRP
jgi:hypothetical protein